MNKIGLIINKSIRNNLRSKSMTVGLVIIAMMITAGIALFFCILLIAPEVVKASPNRANLEIYLSLIIYSACLIGVGINLNVFTFLPMAREKSRGNIESLLATPLKVKEIWIAKSLAVFLPGLVLGELLTLICLISVNYIYFVPRIGFLFTPWIAVSSFFAVPLIYLCLSFLVQLIGLTGKTATGNIIVQIFLPVITTLMINLMLHRVLDAASWTFTLTNLGIAAVLAVIVIFLQPRLIRERIVLARQE